MRKFLFCLLIIASSSVFAVDASLPVLFDQSLTGYCFNGEPSSEIDNDTGWDLIATTLIIVDSPVSQSSSFIVSYQHVSYRYAGAHLPRAPPSVIS